MKHLNIPFEDSEFEQLVKLKNRWKTTWRGMLISLIGKTDEGKT